MREHGTELVPSDKNLSNDEIDLYLKKIESLIRKTIDETIKKRQQVTSSSKYSNATIRLIKQNKNDVIKALHNAKRYPNLYSPNETNQLKARLNGLKTLLKENFRISINKYWEKTLKSISHRDPRNMFPTINKMFRNTKRNNSNTILQIPLAEKDNLENQINITEFEENLYQNIILIHGEKDTVNTLGHYSEKVHRSNETLGTIDNNTRVHNTTNNYRFLTEATQLSTYSKEHSNRSTIQKPLPILHKLPKFLNIPKIKVLRLRLCPQHNSETFTHKHSQRLLYPI